MDKKAHQKTVIIRGVLTAVCIAGGLVFPLLFLLAAFFAWTVYSDLTDPKTSTAPPDAWYARRWTATPDDSEWKSYFLPFCESPAEEAFLEAMIADYALLPKAGMLVESGVELNLQVEHKPYRLDFLLDKWLVVEIDGAAWHSSPEAVERDRIRDEFFVAKGFTVVRIPAKVVFNTPKRAVEMVRAAVARGAPPKSMVASPARASVTQMLMNAAKSVDKFATEVDAHITKASAIQDAMGASKHTFSTEKMVIDSAMETAKKAVDIEAKLAADPNLRKHFDAVYAELEELMQSKRKIACEMPEESAKIAIAPIRRPASHPDSSVNAAILLEYLTLTSDRSRYFDDVRAQISKDPRLSSHVKTHLERLGCNTVWTEIETPPKSLSDLLRLRSAAQSRMPPTT